jgi:hypothetical protein
MRLDSSLWVYGLLESRNEFESGGVVVLVAINSHCDLQQILFQMSWIYISSLVFGVYSSVIYESFSFGRHNKYLRF